MNWDSIQQIVRIMMQWVGATLVTMGFPDDLVTAATGGAVAIAGLAWWWFWERNREQAPAA